MKSREEIVLELFFEQPAKEWHFEEIVKKTELARSKVYKWLQRFAKEGLIKRIKNKGRMPYYISKHDSPEYKNRKKIFALEKLYRCGLLNHLGNLQKAETVILFGSFSRSDWYENSDIDIFIYGDAEGLKIVDYELRLHKDIQLFICKDKEAVAKIGPGLLKNIIKGNIIKGDIDFITVNAHA
ncbi:MAG: nucleotidyltransferase domain-containing protein [Nanoarchaeota archaeon]